MSDGYRVACKEPTYVVDFLRKHLERLLYIFAVLGEPSIGFILRYRSSWKQIEDDDCESQSVRRRRWSGYMGDSGILRSSRHLGKQQR